MIHVTHFRSAQVQSPSEVQFVEAAASHSTQQSERISGGTRAPAYGDRRSNRRQGGSFTSGTSEGSDSRHARGRKRRNGTEYFVRYSEALLGLYSRSHDNRKSLEEPMSWSVSSRMSLASATSASSVESGSNLAGTQPWATISSTYRWGARVGDAAGTFRPEISAVK